jgi:tRNA1Val (adenine37-N6)-methyltransferase
MLGSMSVRSDAELRERLESMTRAEGSPMTLDGLTRDYKIFQRRRGHRHSTDDLLTAWYAVTHAPDSLRFAILELGAGIGSIGLAVAWYFRDASLTAIEVQDASFRLLQQNLWANALELRARAIHGDLRDVTKTLPLGTFDLVLGSPPYFDVNSGIVSADPQRAGARFELRGDVRDYCEAARHALAPAGVFVFCFPTVSRARAESACAAASLSIASSRDVIPKEGLSPLFSLFACRHRTDVATVTEPPFVVRDAHGAHTAELTRARATFGMG